MSIVLTAHDLMQGKTARQRHSGVLQAPVQMLKRADKDEDWQKDNLDWWEQIGMSQLRLKFRRVLKNYNLAKGVIDKEDYINTQDSYVGDMLDILTKETESPLELRFYPIIPNVINLLVGEFTKRNAKVLVKALDEFSINDMLDQKFEMMKSTVLSKAREKIAMNLASQGYDLASQEVEDLIDRTTMELPQIQEFFNKNYRGVAEQWGNHELAIAEERFRMYELEATGFRDSFVVDEEFWHIGLTEDDYFVELWNPVHTFYHKSPDIRYVSQGNYVGRILLMSISDVIDRYGYSMTEDQIKSLESVIRPQFDIGGMRSTGTYTTDAFYDNRRKPSNQIQSIHWSQAMTMKHLFNENKDPLSYVNWYNEEVDLLSYGMVRVTEVYWKSQRKIGHLTEILPDGTRFEDFVSEDFVITNKPQYDLSIDKKESKSNLVSGQHVDWLWVNEVWQGTKIGMNNFNGLASNKDIFDPIYLNVKPLPFQFKGDNSIFGAKLPVEGCSFSTRVGKTTSLVEQMSPWQIGFNLVNNQVVDLLTDEIGNVLLFDQNMIPRFSLDGSWGKHNFVKAYQVMKNMQLMPLDTTAANMESGSLNWNQTSVVSLEKTNQIASRLQLAEYFKNEAFSTVGITPQRLGEVTSSESATGVNAAVNNSYAQTEMYFVQHINYLMPRVKEMILNAAQYVNAKKDSVRVSYVSREEENVFFEIEGTKLLLPDLHIYCTSKPDTKAVLDQLKQLALNNNTSTASIYDLAKVLESNSVSEILAVLKASVDKAQKQVAEERQSQENLVQAKLEADAQENESKRDFEAEQNELDRENQRYIAELGRLANPTEPDDLEQQRFELEKESLDDEMGFKRESERNKQLAEQQSLCLERQKMAQEYRLKQREMDVNQKNQENDLAIEKVRLEREKIKLKQAAKKPKTPKKK